MKDIKDYMPYYIGCKCVDVSFLENHKYYNHAWKLTAIDHSNPRPYRLEDEDDYTWTKDAKPILRRLSDMTEEEGIPIFGKDKYWDVVCQEGDYKQFTIDQFHYLLKQGFDLWGLIDAGLALDSKQLNK